MKTTIGATYAQALILEMLYLGIARIERSPHADLVEFCFDGFRYCCGQDRDWDGLVIAVGWHRCRAAVEKAGGVL